MGVEVGIWAWRLGEGVTEEEENEKEKEKIPLCEIIDHRSLRGRYPAPTFNYNHDLPKQGTGTADHLTLLRLFKIMFPIIAASIGAPSTIHVRRSHCERRLHQTGNYGGISGSAPFLFLLRLEIHRPHVFCAVGVGSRRVGRRRVRRL